MAEQVGKFLTELPELETPTDGDLMYIVDDETTSKKITMANLKRVLGGNVTGTVEGASVSFSDGADGIPMKECEVTLTPTQDLHGYSKPWAGGAGKNKLDKDEISNVNTSFQSKQITLSPNTEYTISTTLPKNNSNSANLFMYLVGGSPDTSVNGVWAGQTRTITTDGTGIVVIGYRSVDYADTSSTWYLSHDMQIEQGSQATTFEPYSNICPISGRADVTVTVASTAGGSGDDTTVSLGRTVYGGTLDVTTGELVVNKASVDLGSLTWTNNSGRFSTGDLVSTIAPIDSLSTIPNFLCTILKAESFYDAGAEKDGIAEHTNKAVVAYIDIYKNKTGNEFATLISGNYLIYPLATPQTFTLSKEQIVTLLGQNYVSHDGGGNIKVVYIRDLDITINDLINRVTALENE